ncbi:post-PEP-CTERM-1 domain-containing protein [Roseateles sp.]|uniref:post-PEP-CTERM-1 domain-containing protein n=1 Tax=Roseateles sp. TaxID=1971397 RepID=UPI00286C7C92|nr:hypothetical protein [Roseateles sp.]
MKINSSPLAAAFAVAIVLATAGASAATVAKDPSSGELRAPTAAEAQALSQPAAGARTSGGAVQPRGLLTGKVNPQPVQHADGSVEHELDESTLSFSVATRNSDGSISQACVTGPDAAAAAMKAPAKSSKKGHSHALK